MKASVDFYFYREMRLSIQYFDHELRTPSLPCAECSDRFLNQFKPELFLGYLSVVLFLKINALTTAVSNRKNAR